MASFFKKLVGFGHGKDQDLPSGKLRGLYETHAGLCREGQFALEEFFRAGASGSGELRLSLHTGTISFSRGEYLYPVQFLGTRSNHDNTWLWAWADRGSTYPTLPPNVLTSVNKLRAFGERERVPELTMAGFPLGDRDRQAWFDVHFLGLVACGLCGGSYVGVPYEGGEMLVAFDAPDLRAHADPALLTIRMTGFFLDVGSVLPIDRFDHRKMIMAYAQQKGYAVAAESNRKIECIMPTGDKLAVVFDRSDHITSCSVLAGTTAAQGNADA